MKEIKTTVRVSPFLTAKETDLLFEHSPEFSGTIPSSKPIPIQNFINDWVYHNTSFDTLNSFEQLKKEGVKFVVLS
jgi:hypothetical protein